jgi:RNA polymerase sigma-70 factor (ECF subfamily)
VSVDQEALESEFETRIRESSTLAFRVAFSVLRNHQDAEDVAQEAFVKAYRKFRHLRERGRFRAWLVRMTWRLAIDRRRSERRRVAREQGEALLLPLEAGPAEAMLTRERVGRLWQAIDSLPEKLRIVVILANIEEQSIEAVAVLLQLPPGTVKSRLFLARKRLKEHLQ